MNMRSQGFLVEKGATVDQLVSALAYFTEMGFYCQFEEDTEPRVFWVVTLNPEEEPITDEIITHARRFGLEAAEIA